MPSLCAVRAVTQIRDSAANLTKKVPDQLNWDVMQSYPKAALERVATMTGKTQAAVQQQVQEKAE